MPLWDRLKYAVLGAVVIALVIGAGLFYRAERETWAKVGALWNWYVQVQQLTQMQKAMQDQPAADQTQKKREDHLGVPSKHPKPPAPAEKEAKK